MCSVLMFNPIAVYACTDLIEGVGVNKLVMFTGIGLAAVRDFTAINAVAQHLSESTPAEVLVAAIAPGLVHPRLRQGSISF